MFFLSRYLSYVVELLAIFGAHPTLVYEDFLHFEVSFPTFWAKLGVDRVDSHFSLYFADADSV